MVIWRGWGVLVFFGILGGIALGMLVIADLLPVESQSARSSLGIAIGFFIASILALGIWLLRFFGLIDGQRPDPTIPKAQRPRRPSSSLFFIPLIAWPVILFAVGLLGLSVGLGEAAR